MKITSVILFSLLMSFSFAQSPTIGLIYDSGLAQDGYTLFAPEQNNDIFLIDNCGEVVNQWTFNDLPGNTAYLLENGNLLQAGKDNLEIRDWDNNLIWEYATTSNGLKLHHDIEPLPNGNILCIQTDFRTSGELIAAGRDPNMIGNNFKMDKIIEIEPLGANGANIVWEWLFWDHLIQEFDNTKANYGVVADHPELIDLNYVTANNNDWTHINGIDYNETLDQIVISSRTISEIYIIDHSTTTAQAASHADGNAGKGGDFLWRWGNPFAYHQGTLSDQKLFGQHDPKWVLDGYLHAGKISVFNNAINGSATYSGVHLLQPTLSGQYNYTMSGLTFAPSDFYYSWSADIMGDPIYSNIKGGVNALPNGGFMICETIKGRFTEINEAGEVVWVYKNPADAVIYNQFDILATGDNQCFRAKKYPINYPGIVGNDLTSTGIIEDVNSLSEACASNSSMEELAPDEFLFVNPVVDYDIEFIGSYVELENVELFDLSGRFIQSWITSPTSFPILPFINDGIYLIKFEMNGKQYQQRLLIK